MADVFFAKARQARRRGRAADVLKLVEECERVLPVRRGAERFEHAAAELVRARRRDDDHRALVARAVDVVGRRQQRATRRPYACP